jgi:hypothetical protein
MICTFLMIFALVIRYLLHIRWQRAVHILTKFDTLWNTGKWKMMAFEIAINLIAPYPFLKGIEYSEYNSDWDFTSDYELNHIATVLAFVRTYTLVRWYLTQSRYMNARAY